MRTLKSIWLVLVLAGAAAAQTATAVDWSRLKGVPPVMLFKVGSGVPTANCATGQDLYLNTSTYAVYLCAGAPNLWVQVGAGGGGTPTGIDPNATWAQIKAGTAGTGSVTPTMTWAEIKAQ